MWDFCDIKFSGGYRLFFPTLRPAFAGAEGWSSLSSINKPVTFTAYTVRSRPLGHQLFRAGLSSLSDLTSSIIGLLVYQDAANK